MKNPRSRFNLFIMIISAFYSITLLAPNGEMPVDHVRLKLSDGRVLKLVRISQHEHLFTLRKSGKLICKRIYEEEYDRVWDWAFFVPVKKNRYAVDLNGDGMPEIAIATWDGGNNITERYALIFTVTSECLRYFDRQKFNLEYGEYVYSEKMFSPNRLKDGS